MSIKSIESLKKYKIFILSLLAIWMLYAPVSLHSNILQSQQVLVSKEENEPVQAILLCEEETIQPGRSFWIAVHLKLDKGWHTYWKNPGDSGMGPQIKWNLPKDLELIL